MRQGICNCHLTRYDVIINELGNVEYILWHNNDFISVDGRKEINLE